jgi:fumarate reductase subunit D
MSDPESFESSDRQTAGSETSRPAGPSLFTRGRRAYYVAQNRIVRTWNLWWHVISACTVLAAMALTVIYLAPALQAAIGVIDTNRLAAVQTLLVTIGGSFVGASAIVSAMLMYALQVNVERMPHKLFRRFSSDHKILLAFLGTIAPAALVASLSMVVAPQNVVLSLLAASWFSFLIVVLFGFAYRRTLDLVSPNFQLMFLVKEVELDLAQWAKHAERFIRSVPTSTEPDEPPMSSSLEVVRLQFFQNFPNWTQRANEALFHAMSFASRYAQKGDHAVVTSAYGAVVAIHDVAHRPGPTSLPGSCKANF